MPLVDENYGIFYSSIAVLVPVKADGIIYVLATGPVQGPGTERYHEKTAKEKTNTHTARRSLLNCATCSLVFNRSQDVNRLLSAAIQDARFGDSICGQRVAHVSKISVCIIWYHQTCAVGSVT